MTRPEVGDDGSQIPAPRSLVASISPAVVASVVEAVQPLSRSVLGARDWQREFMPEVPDLAATFTPAGYDFVARNQQLLGIDSIVAATSHNFVDRNVRAHPELGNGINLAEAYARAHPGIGGFDATQAFTRATEALAGPDLLGSVFDAARDTVAAATRSYHEATLTPGAMTRWLEAVVPRVDMASFAQVHAASVFGAAGMHNLFTADTHRNMFDIAGLHLGFDDLMSPFKGLQFPIGALAGQAPHFASASMSWSHQITELMQGWTTLSGLGHQLCGWALQRALTTRDMVLHDADPGGSQTRGDRLHAWCSGLQMGHHGQCGRPPG
jgi:hypothetical protein